MPATDSASPDAFGAIATLENDTLPDLEQQLGGAVKLGTAGGPPQSRDFEHTVYDNFPYLLLFVVVLTYVLLARAFRSLVLALKAVILNLISLTRPTASSCSSSSRATAARRSGTSTPPA